MPHRLKPNIFPRKQPQQARSAGVIEAILQAAVRVLAKEGAQRFTTARVAERAGISVGSLYQYFPNKAAILFRLQSDEWRQTSQLLRDILQDAQTPALERLRTLVRTFLRSECDEAAIRVALDDAAPLYRDAPQAKDAKASGEQAIQAFLRDALPNVLKSKRALAGELVTSALTTVAKQYSESPRTDAEMDAYAGAMADMFCAYLESLRVPSAARDTTNP